MTKFIASNQAVLDSVPPEDLASCVVDADNRELPTQKTLGVCWNAQLDHLEVKVSIRGKPCTRRGLLSMIGQASDPLGLLQPFLLPARRVLQQACRAGLTWDELVSSAGVGIKEWDKWIEALPCLESVSIPRSFKLLGRKVEQIDLHGFCDASTLGYGSCAYLCVKYSDGFIHCSFVLGKSRVAPLRHITIPRLELTAAVVAVKLAYTVRREVEFVINRVVFWTDAVVVLRYINNCSSRYKSFVTNRLELIHTLSSPQQ